MSKTMQRLQDYRSQMSMYAAQQQIILAKDVLGIIEQLQDDLQDDIREFEKLLEEQTGRQRRTRWRTRRHTRWQRYKKRR